MDALLSWRRGRYTLNRIDSSRKVLFEGELRLLRKSLMTLVVEGVSGTASRRVLNSHAVRILLTIRCRAAMNPFFKD